MGSLIDDECKGAMLTPLKQIPNPKGDIFHAIKASSDGFHGFGEAYFSCVHFSTIKGWKQHTKMVLNLVVISGEIKFYIYDEDKNKTFAVTLSRDNYQRLTIEPGLWVAFEGCGREENILLNVSSIEHDPDEARNMPLDAFSLNS